MFVVPAPGHDGAVLHAAGVSAPVVDGYAVSEDEAALSLLAECFGLGKVEAVTEQPAPTPAPAPVPTPDVPLHVWEDDGGALHVQE